LFPEDSKNEVVGLLIKGDTLPVAEYVHGDAIKILKPTMHRYLEL